MASLDDVVTNLLAGVQNLGLIAEALGTAFPRIAGTFTMSAGTTTVVTNTAVGSVCYIVPFATNTSAASMVRQRGLYQSASTSGVGFALSTETGTAVGTETFQYIGINLA